MGFSSAVPGTGIQGLFSGIQSGNNLMDSIMKPILEREKQKQLEAHFQEQLKLSKAAAGRAAQAAADAHRKMDPMYEINQFKALEDYFRNQGKPQSKSVNATAEETINPPEPGKGMGMYMPIGTETMQQQEETLPEPNTPIQPSNGGFDIELLKQHPMLRGWAKKHLGFDPLAPVAQTPEEKLEDKKKLEEYKYEQKKWLEEEKTRLKTVAEKQKMQLDARKDLPKLERALEGVKKLELITNNNPDLFGHNGLYGFGAEGAAERFARTTDNPNAGAFLAYLSGPLGAGVSELSTRGNQLALKTMLGLKPGFSENQKPAQGKIAGMRDILEQQIAQTRKLAGLPRKDEKVVVIDPSGKKFTTTKENAANLPAGWRRG